MDLELRISDLENLYKKMDKTDLEERTKIFAIKVIRFVAKLPKNKTTDVLGYQIVKALNTNSDVNAKSLEGELIYKYNFISIIQKII